MKITVDLSPENAGFIAEYAALTGYTQEEFASLFFADYFKMFDNCGDDSFLQETIGSMYFKDRESAERVQAWLIEKVSERGVHLNSIKTYIRSHDDGTFDVRLFIPCTWNESGWLTIA